MKRASRDTLAASDFPCCLLRTELLLTGGSAARIEE